LEEVQRLVGSVGFAAIAVMFVAGWVIRIAAGIAHHPAWKIGVRLYASAIAALSIVGGLVILTIPFWRFGDSWWIVLITAPLGAAAVVVGILGCRWIVRYPIGDVGKAGPGADAGLEIRERG